MLSYYLHVRKFVCLSVFKTCWRQLIYSLECGSSIVVVGKQTGLAAVGSATVTVLSQASDVEQPFSCYEVGSHSICAIYRKRCANNSATASSTVVRH